MIASGVGRAAYFVAIVATAACGSPFAPQYEYEEQTYLSVDGRATVVIDSSLAALVALRGLAIDPSPNSQADRESLRHIFQAANCRVDNVSRLWRRRGRRFVQVRITVDDVRRLPACGPLAWSSYSLDPIEPDGLRYRQTVAGQPQPAPALSRTPGAAAASEPAGAGWDGSELIAFKLHLPSRIRWHNVKRLDGTDGTHERGNILTWEQRLSDRRAGRPIAMEVEMESTSILNTTLWIFGGAFAAAVLLLVVVIWLVMRRGRKVKWTPR